VLVNVHLQILPVSRSMHMNWTHIITYSCCTSK